MYFLVKKFAKIWPTELKFGFDHTGNSVNYKLTLSKLL